MPGIKSFWVVDIINGFELTGLLAIGAGAIEVGSGVNGADLFIAWVG